MDLQLKARVRAELFRCALAGEFLTYTQFFERIRPGATMGSFPYQRHFDEVAREERDLGYPDITFMVHGVDGYPHQIDFRPTNLSDSAQLNSLRRGTAALIALYCPGRSHPY